MNLSLTIFKFVGDTPNWTSNTFDEPPLKDSESFHWGERESASAENLGLPFFLPLVNKVILKFDQKLL